MKKNARSKTGKSRRGKTQSLVAQDPVTGKIMVPVLPEMNRNLSGKFGHGPELVSRENHYGHTNHNPKEMKQKMASLVETVSVSHKDSAALSVVLPSSYTMRYRAGWTSEKTAVANPFEISTLDFSEEKAAGMVDMELATGNTFVAVSKDPLNAIVEYYPNPTGKPISYHANFSSTASSSAPATVRPNYRLEYTPSTGLPVTYPLRPVSFTDTQVGSSAHAHPHGKVMFCKRERHGSPLLSWFYMTRGETLRFLMYNSAADSGSSNTGSLNIHRRNGSTWALEESVSFTNVTFVDYTTLDSGWYAASVSISALNDVAQPLAVLGLEILSGGQGGVPPGPTNHLSHRPMPGLDERYSITGMRVNGASIMVTPDSTEMAKGGRVTGIQMPSNFVVEGFVSNANSGTISDTMINLAGSDTRDFNLGGYAYLKPRTQESFDLEHPIVFNIDRNPQSVYGNTGASTVCDYVSYFEPPDGWLCYGVYTPKAIITSGAAPNYAGAIAHVTYDWSVEYTHNDMWLPLKAAPIGDPQFNEIMRLVVSAPQFHENPLHIEDIKRWYNAAVPIAKTIAPGVLLALSKMPGRIGTIAKFLLAAGGSVAQYVPDNI